MSEILFDNGETYVSEHDGELWFGGRLASRDDLDGLRAYFQAERDEQLAEYRAREAAPVTGEAVTDDE